MNAICLTPDERQRLAALYPVKDEPAPEEVLLAPRKPHRTAAQIENLRRYWLKGSRPGIQGEGHPRAVLTTALVGAMRLEAAQRVTVEALAAKYGFPKNTILHAVRGDTWSCVRVPPPVFGIKAHFQERVVAALRTNVLTEWKAPQLAKRLESDVNQTRMALHRLMLRGKVERTGRGVYRWAQG
ncbi:MAG: hypothetical protein WC986_14905 [Elusimicrobiota bacterium]|jgi:hypothetical protein